MSRRDPNVESEAGHASSSGSKLFWKSIEERASVDGLKNAKTAEFPLDRPLQMMKEEAPESLAALITGDAGLGANVSRRGLMKFGTAVTALFGLEGCLRRPVEKLVPYTRAPEQVIPGISNHYATAIYRRGDALGVLVESHDGRPTKVEGNPDHPSSRGSTDALAQASIFDLYDPDRSTTPMHGAAKATHEEFGEFFDKKLKEHDADRGAKLRVLAQPTNSPTFVRLRDAVRARFPHCRFHTYASVGESNMREGARLAFGQPVNALYDYAHARVIVSLDADFLQTEPGMVRATRLFADGRRIRSGEESMSRLYVVESTHSTTGANADHRLRLPSRDVERYARLLAKELATTFRLNLGPVTASLGTHPMDGIPEHWIKAVAKELADNQGRAIVVAGSRQPAGVHALVHALNAALGSVGEVVNYTPVVDLLEQDHAADVRTLGMDMEAGKVETLLILGGNPAYDAPWDAKFADRLGKVATSIHLASHLDETSAKCSWHLPRAHEFEAWGDQRSLDGTWTLQQPLIAPLHGGVSDLEMLGRMIGPQPGASDASNAKPKSGHDHTRDTLRAASTATTGFDKQWRTALQKGLIVGSASFAFTPSEVKGTEIAAELSKVQAPKKPISGANVEVVFLADPKMLDGRHANNPWLQELPDPMTKIVWDNAAHISATTAKELGIESGDMIELSREGARIEIAAWIQPGQADGSISVHLGWGRSSAGRYGTNHGFNVNPLRSLDAMGFTDGVVVKKTGGKYQLSQTQDHHSMEGRPIAIDATLDQYKATPNFPQFRSPNPKVLPLWKPVDYSKGHKWGMNIDLSSCTGCNACVVACQAENNIPTVGKDQVERGREMHWLRIDRYFLGDDIADPEVALQPVACVQCEDAPCENVCPVNATAHSPEGLNDMAYNRCIGTRYCANNCPYKVRRFNFLEYQGDPMYGDLPETVKMQFNPNVTVRMRGVMEKCTYCVQRIQEGKIGSKRTGKPLKDGDITPACAQACPANAIVFGDLNDPSARVTDLAARDRNYALLADIGTHPRTTYLGKIRNPNKEMA